mmetsp:Transcript_11449/g.14922  ORF Transcript_11449/g.14922 Transcript_11449/m.14922 type:complete len:591 (+) Transcript_11449:225-1997(+)
MLGLEIGDGHELNLCLECEEKLCKRKPKPYTRTYVETESKLTEVAYEEEEKLSSDVELHDESDDDNGVGFSESCLFCGEQYENGPSPECDKTMLVEKEQVEAVYCDDSTGDSPSSSWTEVIFMCEPALLRHHVCQWLSVGEVVRLRLVCKWIGTLLRGHELDLEICPTTRRFLVSDIEQCFLSNFKARYESDTELEHLTDGDHSNCNLSLGIARTRKRSSSGIVNTMSSQWTLRGVKLECTDASSLRTFSTLTDAELIKSLSLSFSKPETASAINYLHMFTNLENLNLSHGSQVTDRNLMPLSFCKNLKYLNLSYCENLQTIEPLVGCPNLLVLLLSGCRVLENVRSLSSCMRLEELYLDRCHALNGDWFSSNARNLRKLSMRGCTNLVRLPQSLEGCRKLEEIDLSGCTKLSDVRVLGNRNLRYRSISLLNCESIQDVGFLSVHRSNLVKISLGYCVLVQDIEPINGCLSLEYLDISGCSLAKVPSEMNLLSLKKLVMVGCCRLKDVSGLAKCDNLFELNLAGCVNLNSVDALQSCKSLRTLNLALCTGLYSVASLAKSNVLSHLDLRWCTRIVKKSSERLRSMSILLD